MVSFGKIYLDTVRYKIVGKKPLYEVGWSQETEEPFRRGKCFVLRIPFTEFAVALGVWGPPAPDIDSALAAALSVHELNVELEDVRYW